MRCFLSIHQALEIINGRNPLNRLQVNKILNVKLGKNKFSFVVRPPLLKGNKCAFDSMREQITRRIFGLTNERRGKKKKLCTIGFIFVTVLDYYAKSG